MLFRRRKAVLLGLFLITSVIGWILLLQENDSESEVHQATLEALSGKLPITEFSFYSHPSTCRGAKLSNLPTVSRVIFDDFYQNNNVIRIKPRQLQFSGKQYHIVNEEDSWRIYSGKVPQLEGIPKQLINLSRVGFNPSETQALLCVESQESGDLIYLQKTEGRWQVLKWVYIW